MPVTATYPWVGEVRAAVDANPHAVRRKRMCGYEFRPGDMAWNCRQCQKDETCVLCHACFSASHSNLSHHDVTFYYTQQGTGCCDCGDDEAWDPVGFCAEHNPPTANAGDVDILTSVPPHLLTIAQIDVSRDVQTLLGYVLGRRAGFQRVIKAEDSGLFDLWLHVTETASIRTAPEKLTLVQRNMSPDSVFHWLSTLDSANVSVFNAGDPVVYADVVGILGRLTHCALASDVLCRLVAHEMTHPKDLLGHVIRTEALLPQPESNALHTLIMALLPDPAFKEAFAIAFAESYRSVFAKYLKGHGTPGQTILVLGVQFLNRQSFVHKLIADHELLDELLGALEAMLLSNASNVIPWSDKDMSDCVDESSTHPWDQLALRMLRCSGPDSTSSATTQESGDSVASPRSTNESSVVKADSNATSLLPLPILLHVDGPPFTTHRYSQVLVDLKYVFQIPHDRFLARFAASFRWLCRLLARIQGMGATSRIPTTKDHVLVDSRSWIVYIEMSTLVQEMLSALILNVVTTESTPGHAIRGLVGPIVEALCLWLAAIKAYFPQHVGRVGAPDVVVGVHYPLHHALILVLRGATCSPAMMDAFNAAVDATLPHGPSNPQGAWLRQQIVLPMLRALVWDAQVHVNLWRRNGFGVMNHSMNYGEPYYCMKFRDLDLLGLQHAVAICGADVVVRLVLDQFDVAPLEVRDFDDAMLAECFKLLCQVATELPLGTPSLHARLRRLLIQRLCSKPSTHSELFKCVAEYCAVHEIHVALSSLSLDAAVKELTKDVVQPRQKVYTLDPTHLELYDATSIHLTRKQHEAARLNRLDHRTNVLKKYGPPSTFYPAAPPPLHMTEGLLPHFEAAFYLILRPEICAKLAAVLPRLDDVGANLATMAIHLLTLQLYALRTALDHPTFHELGRVFLDWLPSVVPSLVSLNPWARPSSGSYSHTDHERGRHIQWILHELSIYPPFHALVYSPALASLSPTVVSTDAPHHATPPPRHRAQQLALLRMEKQRAKFLASLDTADVGDDDDGTAWEPCAMCHETESATETEASLCFVGYVHPSALNVPAIHSGKKTPWEDMRREVPLTMQCCGHCVHMGCWDSYFATQFQKVITGEAYLNAVDVKKGEFLCPQCKSISNVLVPARVDSAVVGHELDPLNHERHPSGGDAFDWASWLRPPAHEEPAARPPLDAGLAKLCMSIHRVATGAIEKAHPKRYIATACHAVFTSRWTAAMTNMPFDKIQPLVAAAKHLRHPDLTREHRQLLALGQVPDSAGDALVDTHTLTHVQKTWHSVVGAKPLLLHDLGSIVARGVLLSDNALDAARSVQLVALAFVVQTTLWLLSNASNRVHMSSTQTSDPSGDSPTDWFLREWCGGESKDMGVAVLRHLTGQVATFAPWPDDGTDCYTVLDGVAIELRPFCNEARAMLGPATTTTSWLCLPRLPQVLVHLVHTWVQICCTTYV
ncbi:hypothetical protein, variant [Aphanomyces invadans]|uniref:E3 ubiquitin-protein ligase n=1 Tax=Aphanomyces invadans TaxID=157072 RepID=A0A024TG02_9STRA|nr:hypothetical protein, variant [Aphanomyces invadans]ETV92958.1 hypothetical protein, variant [Aphanomyces invadans]|eukprot:XP_008878478.1 hypothetical protein, variant [Aphanomyces invadans]